MCPPPVLIGLRQGGSRSMQILDIGVNPLIQQLETHLQGLVLYSLPVCGPVEEHEEKMPQLEKKTSIIGYVDDLNPVITKVEEFDICNSYLILFERASGCKFHRDPTSQKCNYSTRRLESVAESEHSSSSISCGF